MKKFNAKYLIYLVIFLVCLGVLIYGFCLYKKQSFQKPLKITTLPALPSYEQRQSQLEEFCSGSIANFLWKVCHYQNLFQKTISWTNEDKAQAVRIADPVLLKINTQNILKDKLDRLPNNFYLCLKTNQLGAEKILSPQQESELSYNQFYYACFSQSKNENPPEIVVSGAIPASVANQKYEFQVYGLKSNPQLDYSKVNELEKIFNQQNLIFEDIFAYLAQPNF